MTTDCCRHTLTDFLVLDFTLFVQDTALTALRVLGLPRLPLTQRGELGDAHH